MWMRLRKWIIRNAVVLTVLIGVLILIRMILPFAIKYGINWSLEHKVPGYYGYIEDFDLVLWRGKYRIEGLYLEKKSHPEFPPLLRVRTIEIGISWRGIFNGRLLTRIHIDGATVVFLDSKDPEKDQLGTAQPFDWRELYWTLVPFELSELDISNSRLEFANIDFGLKSRVFLSEIRSVVRNVQNLDKNQARLPTPVFLRALLQGQTPIRIEGRTNFLLSPPELDLDAEMREFDLKELNPILLSYVPVSFEKGKLSVFAETATRERRLKGYGKVFIDEVRVMGTREQFQSFSHLGVEFLTATANLLLKDKNGTIATKVEFGGNFDDPDIRTGKAIWGALENAYTGKNLERKLDENIDPSSLLEKKK
ncbi:MAG: DUF748 domain-containing protein [Bdellovibrionaceae bacterium]|nr:DUF748 domain-containing protein [Pseudobdellovibrionaceae bacterium]